MIGHPAPEDKSLRARQMRFLDQDDRNAAIASSENVVDVRARLVSRKAMLLSADDCA